MTLRKTDRPTFITIKQIANILGVSPVSAARYSKQPDFPAPFYFTPARKVWLQDEVMNWTMSRRRAGRG